MGTTVLGGRDGAVAISGTPARRALKMFTAGRCRRACRIFFEPEPCIYPRDPLGKYGLYVACTRPRCGRIRLHSFVCFFFLFFFVQGRASTFSRATVDTTMSGLKPLEVHRRVLVVCHPVSRTALRR